MSRLWLMIPPLCDMCSTTLQYFALNFVNGSIYQMLRGGTIVTTFIFSLIILKIKARREQLIGSGMAILGVVIVGVSGLVFGKSEESRQPEVIVKEFRGYNSWDICCFWQVCLRMDFNSLSKKNC